MPYSRLDSTNRKRYLLTNKPGHPPSYVTVISDYLTAPSMLIFAGAFAWHAIATGGLTLSNTGWVLGGILLGGVIGMLASVAAAFLIVGVGAFLTAFALIFLDSAKRIYCTVYSS